MRYGSVEAMVAWLDRGGVAAERKHRMCKNMRRLSPSQRKFVFAVKHVLEAVPSSQGLHREKIMKQLKIGRAMYDKLFAEVGKRLASTEGPQQLPTPVTLGVAQ